MSTIGDRIRARREMAGLSQAALARLLGVTPATLNYWERGHKFPTLKRARQIADALLMDLYELLEDPHTEDEALLVSLYRQLDPVRRQKIINLLRSTNEVRRIVARRTSEVATETA